MVPDFQGIPILFLLPFLIVLGVILFGIIKRIVQWNSNNHQAVLTVPAKIVSKRTKVDTHTFNNNGTISNSSSTYYYVTFEVESGDRIELQVRGWEYGQLAENDQGKLTFQGTRFKGYVRYI